MGGEWQTVTVGEVATRVTKGTTPTTVGGQFVEGGINFVKVESITDDGRIENQKLAHIDDSTNTLLSRSILCHNDILFTIAGTIGRVALVPENILPANTNQAVAIVRPNIEIVLPRFLYYVFGDESRVRQAHTRIVQSVQANFSLGELSSLEIPLPSLPEQRAIVHILGTLDDKIELNRRMNETQEAIARALFKSWFVDFDPVRAKAEGRDPCLPQHIADLFPDSFEASELGEIPKGWSATRWGTLATLEYGKSLSGYAGVTGTYPVFGTNGRIGNHSVPLCKHPGIIIGRKGAYRGVHFCDTPFFVIDTAFYVEPSRPVELRWAYYELLRHDINSMDSGSAIPSTSRDDFYSLPVLSPPFEVQHAFASFLSPFWARQKQSDEISRSLAVLRDTLLPKLISGELRVPSNLESLCQ